MTRIANLALVRPDDNLPTIRRHVERLDLVRYAGASDDYVHLHWDLPRVQAEGFPDVLIHGWLTFSWMCRTVSAWAPREIAEPLEYSVRYLLPMFPGIVDCGGEVTFVETVAERRIVHLAIWAKDGEGNVSTRGTMRLGAVQGN
jgi:acyl dehydratase